MSKIRLYIANLGKYVEGFLVGDWIDLPYTEEELHELFCKIKLGYMDENGEYQHGYTEGNGMYVYEEWAIHDYETELPIHIGEYHNLNELNEIAESIENYDDYDFNVLKAIIESTGYPVTECIEILDRGDYMFLSDVSDCEALGEAVIDEGLFGVEIPDSLIHYIDYEKIGRDLSFDGWSFTEQGAIWVS